MHAGRRDLLRLASRDPAAVDHIAVLRKWQHIYPIVLQLEPLLYHILRAVPAVPVFIRAVEHRLDQETGQE